MESMWRSVPKLYYAARKFLFARAEEYGMKKGQPRILDYVFRHDGCIQREIAEEYSLKAPTVTSFLKVLEEERLIRRTRKPESSRQINVSITEEGVRMQEKLETVYDTMDEIVFQGFTEEEKEQSLDYLSRMADNMLNHLREFPVD